MQHTAIAFMTFGNPSIGEEVVGKSTDESLNLLKKTKVENLATNGEDFLCTSWNSWDVLSKSQPPTCDDQISEFNSSCRKVCSNLFDELKKKGFDELNNISDLKSCSDQWNTDFEKIRTTMANLVPIVGRQQTLRF